MKKYYLLLVAVCCFSVSFAQTGLSNPMENGRCMTFSIKKLPTPQKILRKVILEPNKIAHDPPLPRINASERMDLTKRQRNFFKKQEKVKYRRTAPRVSPKSSKKETVIRVRRNYESNASRYRN